MMGSTPSRTRVMAMQLHVARVRDGRDHTAASSPLRQAWAQEEYDLRERVEGLEALLLECQERMDEAEERARAAESQVEVLRQKLKKLKSYISRENASEPTEHHSATVNAQKQYIKKLEVELAEAKQEMLQTREKCGRKLQKVRASSAKSQAKSALSMFELRDENTKLQEENTRLLDEVSHIQAEKEVLSCCRTGDSNQRERGSGSEGGEDTGSAGRDGHMRLILELSQQVSSLDAELRQAHETIQKLRGEQQSASAESSPLFPSSAPSSSSASYIGRTSVGNSKHSLFEEPEEEV